MPLRLGCCFRFGFCLSCAEAARTREAERWLKQHAMVFGRGSVAFAEEGKSKLKRKITCISACCFSSGSASFLGAACARVKQHAKVKWNGSLSSMSTEAYEQGNKLYRDMGVTSPSSPLSISKESIFLSHWGLP